MKITWLGHSGFRIEIAGETLLIDPWLRGNPVFQEWRFEEAVRGATAILLSHGHFDHASNALEIAATTGAKIHGIYDLVSALGVEGVGFNKGGTVAIGDVAVTMVNAVHSSSIAIDGKPVPCGAEAGFVIAGEGRTIYFAGDTDVHSDMQIVQDLHAPDIGILPVGGHFTMDQARAAYACKRFFRFSTVIPCHHRTFPLLAQNADALAAAIAPAQVLQPEVMETLTL
jgi:L-ascorbate metabolism protein UlaG (beta-lactamase superfamily)